MPPVLPPAIQLTESKIIPVVESLFLLQGSTADRHVSREIFLTLQKVCWFLYKFSLSSKLLTRFGSLKDLCTVLQLLQTLKKRFKMCH